MEYSIAAHYFVNNILMLLHNEKNVESLELPHTGNCKLNSSNAFATVFMSNRAFHLIVPSIHYIFRL